MHGRAVAAGPVLQIQCGEDVLRMFVTGAPPVRGGGGIPQRIATISVPVSVLRMTGAG